MTISEYNLEQLEAIRIVRYYLRNLSSPAINDLKKEVQPYLKFREDVEGFHKKHLSEICTDKCFSRRASDCCGRESIATFFADVFINALFSSKDELDLLEQILSYDKGGFKCVYLTDNGCLWRIKPIVCEMFLCDYAKEALAEGDNSLMADWEELEIREKRFTWPDRPVLFDEIEKIFLNMGVGSPLMYFHKSPGLLRVKAEAEKTGNNPGVIHDEQV